jgi:hypothetical protein
MRLLVLKFHGWFYAHGWYYVLVNGDNEVLMRSDTMDSRQAAIDECKQIKDHVGNAEIIAEDA